MRPNRPTDFLCALAQSRRWLHAHACICIYIYIKHEQRYPDSVCVYIHRYIEIYACIYTGISKHAQTYMITHVCVCT